MALSDFQSERREVSYQGKPLMQVEGLSLESLAVLVKTHLPDYEGVLDILMHPSHEESGDTMDQIFSIATAIASQAPGLSANIIAVCQTDEPVTEELVAKARRLPFPLQIDALTKIGELTFNEAGGIKKSMESLINLLMRLRMSSKKSVTPAPSKKQRSSASTPESAAT